MFVEFRNKLFSLFTFNRHTRDFILNDLLTGISPEVKKVVEEDLNSRLRMDMPQARMGSSEEPGYDAILSKFHNPFEVAELFRGHQFKDVS